MARSDDLVPLLAAKPAAGVGFRQGVVLTWDQTTAENTVSVGGAVLTNVPVLNTSEAVSLTAGAVVGLLTSGPSWFILGRITIPGTPEAASALAIGRTTSAQVGTAQATASGSYTDLATAGPEVEATIGPSGKCLVIVSTEIRVLAPRGSAIATGGGLMSFAMSGANVAAAIDARAAEAQIRYDSSPNNTTLSIDVESGTSRVTLLTGLDPGATTFTAKYAAVVAGSGTATFANRNLTVIPL